MNKGVILFAHNNRQIDYAKMALAAGSLANKNLKVPVSLVTDDSTVAWMKQSNEYTKALKLFDKIIIVDRPSDEQNRKHNDGKNTVIAPFKNSNRCSVWDVTPYERTLMIDSDYFVLSDRLNEYWDVESDILISTKYNDIMGSERIGYHDRYISDTGIRLLWATTVMFTKNENTKIFFDLVEHIKQNYRRFADIFRFDHRLYRNDISFAIARHILYGFETDDDYSLPPVLSVTDKDNIYSIEENKIKFLIQPTLGDKMYAASITNQDIHIMNKAAITRNIDKLMELV